MTRRRLVGLLAVIAIATAVAILWTWSQSLSPPPPWHLLVDLRQTCRGIVIESMRGKRLAYLDDSDAIAQFLSALSAGDRGPGRHPSELKVAFSTRFILERADGSTVVLLGDLSEDPPRLYSDDGWTFEGQEIRDFFLEHDLAGR